MGVGGFETMGRLGFHSIAAVAVVVATSLVRQQVDQGIARLSLGAEATLDVVASS